MSGFRRDLCPLEGGGSGLEPLSRQEIKAGVGLRQRPAPHALRETDFQSARNGLSALEPVEGKEEDQDREVHGEEEGEQGREPG